VPLGSISFTTSAGLPNNPPPPAPEVEEDPKSPPDDAPEAPEPPKREDPDPDPDPKIDWEEDCTVEVVACPNMEEEVAGCCDAGDENKPPPGVVDPEPPKMEDPVDGAAEVTAEPKID